MKSKEIVRRTLEYDNPERVARSFGLRHAEQDYGGHDGDSDFVDSACSVKTHATEWRQADNGRWDRIDEWGNVWRRLDFTSKGEVIRGVLEDLSDLDSCELPDYSNPEGYECVKKTRLDNPDKWLIGSMPGFAFNIARKMRKLDQYLMDLILERDRLHELHDRIDAMLEDMIRNYAAMNVDSVMFPEDWGTQSQLLINPKLWREEFFPRFEKLCGIAHECGIRVFMHSCGQTEEIVPGFMEAGIDLLQFDQPDLHGIGKLARHQESRKITFWCPVDIQTTLQTRNEQVIRAKAKEMLDKLWKGSGGFVAGYYGDNASIGLDPKYQQYACDEFLKHGVRINYVGYRANGAGPRRCPMEKLLRKKCVSKD